MDIITLHDVATALAAFALGAYTQSVRKHREAGLVWPEAIAAGFLRAARRRSVGGNIAIIAAYGFLLVTVWARPAPELGLVALVCLTIPLSVVVATSFAAIVERHRVA